jgi:hypothetical protein
MNWHGYLDIVLYRLPYYILILGGFGLLGGLFLNIKNIIRAQIKSRAITHS